MSLTSISTEGLLYTNELAPITGAIEGDHGLAEVEMSDENEVSLHLRHYADTSACLTLAMSRADALALSEVLRAAARGESDA